jgi:plastocyanin
MAMHARRHLLTAGTVALCVGAGGAGVAHAASTTTVTLKDISFKKENVHIMRGASVKWVWKDGDTPHNVTFAHRHSKVQKSGTYKLRFTKAGTFRYLCTLHPGMVGKVIVK